jgi:hypothetical protein
MKLYKLIVFALMAALFISCSDNDDKDNNLHLVTKISTDNGSAQFVTVLAEFAYDNHNRLATYSGGNDAKIDFCVFTYDDNGLLTKFILTFDDGGLREYSVTYKDSKTIEVSYPENNTIVKDIYELNDKGLLKQFTENPDGGDGSWLKFEYDNNGNILKITDEEGAYTQYTYDNKNSFLKDLVLPQWVSYYIIEFPQTPNNVTSITHYKSDGSIDDGTQTYTYTYNDAGYPASYIYEYGTSRINYKIDYKLIK